MSQGERRGGLVTPNPQDSQNQEVPASHQRPEGREIKVDRRSPHSGPGSSGCILTAGQRLTWPSQSSHTGASTLPVSREGRRHSWHMGGHVAQSGVPKPGPLNFHPQSGQRAGDAGPQLQVPGRRGCALPPGRCYQPSYTPTQKASGRTPP